MEPSLVEQVRVSCARVAESAQLVTINHRAIAAYAAAFDVMSARSAADSDIVGDPNDPERAIALALASVAINFTSGWHDVIRKRPGRSGAVSMVERLTDYEQATGAFTPARLQAITVTDCSQIFEQELDGDAVERMLALLTEALNDLGALGAEHGSYELFVIAAGQSAVRLAAALGRRKPWRDVAMLDGNQVAFYKRAQMAAATLRRTFGGTGLGEFSDIDELTIFADNLVPHVLRLDGLLSYDAELAATIQAGELIAPGSRAEVEIRACGVHVAELLATELRVAGQPILVADIDHALWSRGGGARYKSTPRHRCRNPFY